VPRYNAAETPYATLVERSTPQIAGTLRAAGCMQQDFHVDLGVFSRAKRILDVEEDKARRQTTEARAEMFEEMVGGNLL